MTCRHAPMLEEIVLPADDRAPARARDFVAMVAGDCDAPLVDDARLMVSELVSNVVRHAKRDELTLRVETTQDGGIRVEVVNPGRSFRPTARAAAAERVSGWGLEIVNHLASRWGVRGRRPVTVWFELEPQ